MNEFNIGDVVYLNGDGGLQLTVESYTASGGVTVVWFDQDDRLQRETFSPCMLYRS